MMIELKADQFDRVRCLFQETDYSLSILAAIEGNNPGRIFVDDIEHLKTSLELTVTRPCLWQFIRGCGWKNCRS